MILIRNYLQQIRLFRKDVRLFLLANLLFGLGGAFFNVLLNLLFDSAGFSKSMMGDVQGAIALGMAASAVPVAALYDRVDVRRLLIGSVLVATLALGALASLKTVAMLLSAAFLMGSATAVHLVAAGPFIMRNTAQSERVYAFGLSFATEILAGIIGAMLAGWIPKLSSGNPIEGIQLALWVGVGFVSLALLPYLALTSTVPERRLFSAWKIKALSNDRLALYLRMILPDALIGIGAGITIPFLNVYLKTRFHLDTTGVGIVFAVTSACTVAGVLLSPVLGERFGLMRTVAASQLISIPFMITLALTFDVRIAFLAVMVRGALMNMSHPLARAFQLELITQSEQATVNSLASLGWNGAWILGTTIGGRLIERHGFTVSILCTSAIYLLSTLLYLLFWAKPEYARIGRKTWSPPEHQPVV